MKSSQSQVAAIIRKELKKFGISAKVTSKGYSMGDSVNVSVTDQPPWVVAKIRDFCEPFQYGHFNGMEDIYEYSNSREDIPQTKYLNVQNYFSDELTQLAWEELKERLSGFEDAPLDYKNEAYNFYNENAREMATFLMCRYLRNEQDFGYFKKARIAA